MKCFLGTQAFFFLKQPTWRRAQCSSFTAATRCFNANHHNRHTGTTIIRRRKYNDACKIGETTLAPFYITGPPTPRPHPSHRSYFFFPRERPFGPELVRRPISTTDRASDLERPRKVLLPHPLPTCVQRRAFGQSSLQLTSANALLSFSRTVYLYAKRNL